MAFESAMIRAISSIFMTIALLTPFCSITLRLIPFLIISFHRQEQKKFDETEC